MVALATISINHNARRKTKHRARQTTNRNNQKRVNKPPLIGLKTQNGCSNHIVTKKIFIRDARTIDNLEQADPSAQTRHLIARWRDLVKPGIYRQSGGRWKKYHEPNFLRNKRRVIKGQLQQAIRNIEDKRQRDQAGGFQPQSSRQEQWTVDLFCNVDKPQASENPENNSGLQQQITQQHSNNQPRSKRGKLVRNLIKIHLNSKSLQSIGRSTWAIRASNTT